MSITGKGSVRHGPTNPSASNYLSVALLYMEYYASKIAYRYTICVEIFVVH